MDNNQMNNNQMNNNQMYNNQMNKPAMPTKQLFEYIGLGCACLGFLLTVIFTIITCCKPKLDTSDGKLKLSLLFIVTIVGILITIGGVVLTILSMEKGQKPGKLATVALIVSFAALVFGIIPNITMCSYNCSFNGSDAGKLMQSYSNYSGMEDFDW